MTTYVTPAIREQVEQAQLVLDPVVAASTRRPTCGAESPCLHREAAAAVVRRYRAFPVRWPMASKPERFGAARGRLFEVRRGV